MALAWPAFRERSLICLFQQIDAPCSFWSGDEMGTSFDDSFIAVAVFCTMNSSSLDLEDSTDAGASLQSR